VSVVAHRAIYLLPYRPVLLAGRGDTDRAAQRRAQEVIARVYRDAARAPLSWRQIAFFFPMFGVFPLVYLFVSPLLASMQRGLPFVLQFALLLVATSLVTLPFRWLMDKQHAPRVRAALLAERICASCAYDLSRTPSEPDGLTTCPECGAAWRM
ncbi:MAG: hypothetical protein K2Q20_00160, partial [Phycisphaerales bacterium]|nr:hypothetical protein [Phycisphaerales bacterium]